jgi:hypothetical protein
VDAAEKGDFEEAGRQRRFMFASELGGQRATDALRRALLPLKEETARLCAAAEAEARTQPRRADAVVRKLFSEKKKLLQAFNFLLGSGDQMHDAVFDMVAQAGRSCVVEYANETEEWAISEKLGEECLALAEGEALRARLEGDLEVITSNLAAQRRRQSQSQPGPHSSSARPSTAHASPASPRSPASSHPSKVGGWIAAAVVVLLISLGVVKGWNDNRTTEETSQVKAQIESERSHLSLMETDLESTKQKLDGFEAEITSDKALLEQMKRNGRLGLPVSEGEYETIRQRHNNAVDSYNAGIANYNDKLAEYKELLRKMNEKVDRYNSLVKSQ